MPRRYFPFTLAVLAAALVATVGAVLFAGSRPWLSNGVFWLLAILCLLGEALPIRLARRANYDEVTVSTAFAFAVLLAFGPAPAIVMYALASAIVDSALRRPLIKVVFNASQYAVSLAAAAAVLAACIGTPDGGSVAVAGAVPAIVLSGLALFVVNHVLAGVGSAILTSRPVRPYLVGDVWFHAWTAGFQLAVAPVLVVCAEIDVMLIPLMFLPAVAIFVGGRQAVINQHRALHDDLTELPNRQLFRRRLEDAIVAADEDGSPLVVMLADLDDFKAVNDSLGHDVGDLLLAAVAERLSAAAPANAVLARLGGDEFAVLLPDTDAAGGMTVAERMLERLETPIEVASFSLDARASFGIAAYPDHGASPQALQKNADVALYRAKETRTRCEAFGDRDVASFDRLSLAEDLRRGIERDELVVHYQPKLALSEHRLDGVEALVRWQHPQLGLLSPESFIPLAEQSNLIKPLTGWMIDHVLGQCRAWRDGGLELQVAVNLSTRSLLDRGLTEQVVELLAKWELPPSVLVLEITETKIIADFGRARQVLHELRALGVRIAIDDFGTGYSSLVQLQQLPADEIKIDRSFVMDMERNANNAAIVRSTVGLARNLALDVTAEGVESDEAYEQLVELGCDHAQGYYLGRPVPADGCERQIRRHTDDRRFARARPERTAKGGGLRAAARAGLVALALGVAVAAPGAAPAEAAAGDYVVVYRDGVDATGTTAALERTQNFRAKNRFDAAVRGFSAYLTDAQRSQIEADSSVEYVTPDITFEATGMTAVAAKETVPPGIRRTSAATTSLAHTPANGAVAVLDSGLDLGNTDLNAVSGTNCVTPGATAQDDNGHGTHVGGTIGGRNTGTGVVGVAPGTKLYAVKVLNSKGSGSLSTILCGLDWVTRNAAGLNIRVANVSLVSAGKNDGDCGRMNNDALHAAVCSAAAAGVSLVAAAGNANVDLATMVPAAYPEALTVTAMTDTDGIPGGKGAACNRTELDDTPWSTSNFAVSAADAAHVVAAPGACVLSSKLRGGTVAMSGTSMAAPHVAGAVALCLGNGGAPGPCAGLTPAGIVQRIRSDAQTLAETKSFGFTGDPRTPLGGKTYGYLLSAATY